MSEVTTIAVTALPAAGKSVATRNVRSELEKRGFRVLSYSDKEALLAQVEEEIKKAGKSLETRDSIEVDNFTLLNPSEPRVSWGIKFKEATTLNEAHRKLFEQIADTSQKLDGKTKIVVELAYGENAPYPNGPLRQNAKDFLDQFEQLGILQSMIFIDVFARLVFRGPRNDGRINEVGYIPREEFYKYFKDIGGWTREDRSRLDGTFRQIRNEFIPKSFYEWRVRQTTENYIVPLIRGEKPQTWLETPFHSSMHERGR